MDDTLFSILNSDPGKNIATLGFFSAYPVKEYFTKGNTALILGKSDHLWAHISSSSENDLSLLLSEYHDKTKYYFSVEEWMIPLILKYGEEEWKMTTDRYTLEQSIITGFPKHNIISIDKSYAEYIYCNSDYKAYTSVSYIEDRLSKDISAGIFINDILVAWGFTHDDGALGFLHVLEEHRGKGYGAEILLGLVQMRRKGKRPVFGNIVPDNTASIKLVTKLGFKLACRASWIKIK